MEIQEHETMSSFNKRFASLYYKIPKEIQPLENTAKLYYASTFPPILSLLLLEGKPVSLQQMLVDSLEVEYNLRMSKNLSNQESGDISRIDKTNKELWLKEQHEQETFSLHFNPSYCEQNDDQTSDVQEECYNDLFYEDCNQLVTNSVIDGFQENFSLPIYDEYEDDYLDSVHKQPTEHLASSWPFIKENKIAIHDQNYENTVDSSHVEGHCFPLCFSSFERLKKTFRVINKKTRS